MQNLIISTELQNVISQPFTSEMTLTKKIATRPGGGKRILFSSLDEKKQDDILKNRPEDVKINSAGEQVVYKHAAFSQDVTFICDSDFELEKFLLCLANEASVKYQDGFIRKFRYLKDDGVTVQLNSQSEIEHWLSENKKLEIKLSDLFKKRERTVQVSAAIKKTHLQNLNGLVKLPAKIAEQAFQAVRSLATMQEQEMLDQLWLEVKEENGAK